VSNKYFKIKNTPNMGRGLFAVRDIRKDIVIEKSPVLVLEKEEVEGFFIDNYAYHWYPYTDGVTALALGFGSLFNHSINDNIEYINDYDKDQIIFKTMRPIKKGEQLFIDYGYDPLDPEKKRLPCILR